MIALFTSLLLAHALWAGSGFACGMPAGGHSSNAGAVGAEMAGMDMTVMDMPGAPQQTSGESPAHDYPPCNLPWAPDGCQSMAPCAPAALPSGGEVLSVPNAAPPAVAPPVVLAPPSQVRAPEIPPPRA